MQTLGATVQATTTYVLRLSIGARADFPFTGYFVALMAGNVTLAYDNSSLSPAAGTFLSDQIRYLSGHPIQEGQPLQIFVKSLGAGQVNIDNVSLTAMPTAN